MRRIGLALLVAALALPAASAHAAKAPTAAQVNALTKQVKTLQAQVKKLQAQVTKDTKNIDVIGNLAFGTFYFQVCQNAVVADALQGTWSAIDSLATGLGRPAIWGPQTPITDANTCREFPITRSQVVPPNVSVFSALAALAGTSR